MARIQNFVPARPRKKMMARGVEEGGMQQGGFQLEAAFFRNLSLQARKKMKCTK